MKPKRIFLSGSLAAYTKIGPGKFKGLDVDIVSFGGGKALEMSNHHHVPAFMIDALDEARLRIARDAESEKPPTAAQFILCMMSKERRHEVYSDMQDWYPDWRAEHGKFGAWFLCWWRIGCAAGGGLLDLALRIGEIVGKFRGAK